MPHPHVPTHDTAHDICAGDGFAFWYVEAPELLGPVYGSADYWKGIGIFFDTFNNDNRSVPSVRPSRACVPALARACGFSVSAWPMRDLVRACVGVGVGV